MSKLSSQTPPKVSVPFDWEEVNLPYEMASGRTMYSGQEQSAMARFRFYRKKDSDVLYGRAWFGERTNGPPGHVHGGALAYLLDEAMGSCAWLNKYPVVASRLEFEYLNMSPLFTDLHVEARMARVSEENLVTEGKVFTPDGTLCVTGIGYFAILTQAQALSFKNKDLDPDGKLAAMKLKWAPK